MFIQMYSEKYMRFPDGRAKALTFSYDDGVAADRRLLGIFARYGMRGTFNLNNRLFDAQCWHGRMNEEDTLNAFRDCGQEVALHGARHIFLEKVTLPEAVREVADNRAYLERKFGRIVRGMAYAYGSVNQDIKRVLADSGVVYARTTVPTYDFSLPRDWLEWNPTCHHTDERLAELAERFFAKSPESEFKNREPWLFYVWGHAYEFDDDDNWNVIENLCKRAEENSDKIWFATNIEIYDYVRAYNNLVFSSDGETCHNPSAISVWLEIRGKAYEIRGGETIKF